MSGIHSINALPGAGGPLRTPLPTMPVVNNHTTTVVQPHLFAPHSSLTTTNPSPYPMPLSQLPPGPSQEVFHRIYPLIELLPPPFFPLPPPKQSISTRQMKLNEIMDCFSNETPCYTREALFRCLQSKQSSIMCKYLHKLLETLVDNKKLKKMHHPTLGNSLVYALPDTVDIVMKIPPCTTQRVARSFAKPQSSPKPEKQANMDAIAGCFSADSRHTRTEITQILQEKGIQIPRSTLALLIQELVAAQRLVELGPVLTENCRWEIVYSLPDPGSRKRKHDDQAPHSSPSKRTRQAPGPTTILSCIDDAALTAVQISNNIGMSLEETQQGLEMLLQEQKILPYGQDQWVTIELHAFLQQISAESSLGSLPIGQVVPRTVSAEPKS